MDYQAVIGIFCIIVLTITLISIHNSLKNNTTDSADEIMEHIDIRVGELQKTLTKDDVTSLSDYTEVCSVRSDTQEEIIHCLIGYLGFIAASNVVDKEIIKKAIDTSYLYYHDLPNNEETSLDEEYKVAVANIFYYMFNIAKNDHVDVEQELLFIIDSTKIIDAFNAEVAV